MHAELEPLIRAACEYKITFFLCFFEIILRVEKFFLKRLPVLLCTQGIAFSAFDPVVSVMPRQIHGRTRLEGAFALCFY
jgi:hypothetical protein